MLPESSIEAERSTGTPDDAARRFVLQRWIPQFWAGLVLALSLFITYLLWSSAQRVAVRDLQEDFDFRVHDTVQNMVRRMATYEQVLRGAQGFMLGSIDVSREAFHEYVAALHLEQHYPGIQGIAIAEIVPRARKERHIAAIRSEGFPGYTIHPDGEREMYSAITHIEPFTGMNLRAFGFDMLSEPTRRAAMMQARDTGKAALSGKVKLIQEGRTNVQPGFVMYLPVFAAHKPTATPEERRANILGWIGAPFRMGDLMAGLEDGHSTELRVRVYDGKSTADQARFYDSGLASGAGASRAPLFESREIVTIAGHAWTLVADSSPAFDAQLHGAKPRVIAIGGISISFLLAILVWVLASGRRRALALAADMTRELRASEFRWKYALEGAGDGVWDWNTQTGEVLYSKRWKEMLGYEAHEIADCLDEWEKRVHPDDRAHALQAVDDYLAGRSETYDNELRMLCKDGSWKWIKARGMAVSRDADGRPLRIIGTHADITESKRDREALKESNKHIAAEQQRMKVILENSHDAFVAIDRDGAITDWNIKAERIFGWLADEAIGQNLAQLIIPENQREAHNAGLRRFVDSGSGPLIGKRVEVVALHRDGKEIPVELAIASVRGEGGYVANAFIRDLTEAREAERAEAQRKTFMEEARVALQHSQKLEAVGKLTGGVAHDFNNVLQIIAGNIQLLLDDGDEKTSREKRLQNVLGAVDRGSKLSSQLLAFARRQPLEPLVVNIGRLVRNMDDLLRRALGEAVEIETIVAGGLWNTLVDPYQLENVILNLAINARDAMNESGKLTIELGNAMLDDDYVLAQPDVPAGQYVVLAISDTGSGMTTDIIERAFEPFFTTKPEGEGTGLGLSMAYGFVKQSGGHIRIYSEIGQGTTVRIYLPRSHEPEEMLTAHVGEPVVGGSETILVVEDDIGVQTTVVAMLKELGYHVLTAHDGQSALEVIESGAAIDLLFTDVVMPGKLRSPDLARQAKRLLPDVAVLFTSGYTQNAIVHGGRLDPGVNLLSKPYRREQLARKVRHVIANQQQVRISREANAIAADAAVAPSAVSRRILVVEDNVDLLRIACDLLSLLGHRPRGVASAEEALRMMSAERYDILFSDIGLPGMSGVELAEKMVREQPGIRVVFVTGYSDTQQKPEGFEFVMLKKPYNIKNLQQVLESQ